MSHLPAAYYARGRSGWRAWWTLLHPPYTLMHLSYVVVGAALAPQLNLRTLLATLLAFFFAVGVAAHALDELDGRPLGTLIPRRLLILAAIIGLGAATTLGLGGMLLGQPHLLWFIVLGVFLTLSYNLGLFGGLFHTDLWFGLGWGAFPVLTAYFAQTGILDMVALLGAGYALLLSLAQRCLSTPARRLRRRTQHVEGVIHLRGSAPVTIDRQLLLRPLERALKLLVRTSLLLAAALLAMRLLPGQWIADF